VDIAVGDDLDIAFAERDEEQHTVAVVRGADDADGEFAMGEPASLAALDRRRHDPQAQRQPIEREHEARKNRCVDHEAGADAERWPQQCRDARHEKCEPRPPGTGA